MTGQLRALAAQLLDASGLQSALTETQPLAPVDWVNGIMPAAAAAAAASEDSAA